VAANLHGKNVVKEGEDHVGCGSWHRRAGQPGPGDLPGEVWLAGLYLRWRKDRGELRIFILVRDVQ
jgi:hypothetical protein